MKFVYYNDTNRDFQIHPATKEHGTECDMLVIKPQEERTILTLG